MEIIFSKVSVIENVAAMDVFLSVFQRLFYGYFQTMNRNAFLWMISLLSAKIP